MFRTWLGLTLLVLLTFFKGGRLEDLVIAQAGRLSVVSLCSSRELHLNTSSLRDVSAMTYDSATGRLLLSGAEADGVPRLWTLQMSDGKRPEPVTFSGAPPGRLEGLAVSADHSALFAADVTNGAILRVPLQHVLGNMAAVSSVLHMLPDDRPRGLAVDETSGLLFWTNWRFGRQSVERSDLDGSDRRRLVDSDLYLPGGVAADPASSAVFFSDAGSDGRLHVERAAQDGSGRRVVHRGRHPQAAGLQLSAGSLYWSDSAGVWRLPLTADGTSAAADAQLVAPLTGRPNAVLVLRQDEQCTSYTSVAPTAAPALVSKPPPGVCDGYCVVGRCRWDELRGRACRCPSGFSGERCERDACQNFCLAGARCHRDVSGQPLCACPDGATGERCQHQISAVAAAAAGACEPALGLPPSALRLLVWGLLLLLTLQSGLLAVLGVRLRRATRAARAASAAAAASPPPPQQQQQRKRFVGIGRQLRPRPSPPRRDIEDCCQMTLCETPCVVSTAACERQGLVDQKSDGCDNPQKLADLF